MSALRVLLVARLCEACLAVTLKTVAAVPRAAANIWGAPTVSVGTSAHRVPMVNCEPFQSGE